jgi:hypothetical protein
MKAALALAFLAALCAVVSGCGSSRRMNTPAVQRSIIAISSLPKVSGMQCATITFDSRTRTPRARPVKCSDYHPVPAHKE